MIQVLTYLEQHYSFILLLLLFGVPLIKWHFSSKSAFNLTDLVLDKDTGKASLFRTGQTVALVISSWAFILLVEKNSLTWEYFATYMAAWGAANIANIAINKPKVT